MGEMMLKIKKELPDFRFNIFSEMKEIVARDGTLYLKVSIDAGIWFIQQGVATEIEEQEYPSKF